MSLVTSSPTVGGVGRTRTDRAGRSQCDRILARLQEQRGFYVPMPELALAASKTGVGMAVHSRIADLRRRGYQIEQRGWHGKDGMYESYYLLASPLPPERWVSSEDSTLP